jgi:hypothetical protein
MEAKGQRIHQSNRKVKAEKMAGIRLRSGGKIDLAN